MSEYHESDGMSQTFGIDQWNEDYCPCDDKDLDSPLLKKQLESFYLAQKKLAIKEPDEFNSHIFSRLESREKYQNQDACKVCDKPFKTFAIKSRKHCKFCGNSVCSDHGRKRRGNPHDKSQFVRICDNCERLYLKKMIYEEFRERKNQYDKETEVLDSQLKNKMGDIKNKQSFLDGLLADKENKDRDFNVKRSDIDKEIGFHKKEIEKLDDEMSRMIDVHRKSDSKANQLREELKKLESQNKIWENEELELEQMIQAVDLDIEQTEYMIEEVNKKITDYNLKQRRKLAKKKEGAGASQNEERTNPTASPNAGKKENWKTNITPVETPTAKGEKSINHSDSVTTPKFSHYQTIAKEKQELIKPKDESLVEEKESCKMCSIF